MKKIIFLALILTGLLQACKNNSNGPTITNGKLSFTDSALSTLRVYQDEKGNRVIQKNNTFYDVAKFLDSTATIDLLLKITMIENAVMDSPASMSRFEITVNNLSSTGTAHWTKLLTGEDIDYSNKVLTIHTSPKNNNEEDTYTQYSLLSGAPLMTYTYSPLSALIPNTSHKRFFGYLSQNSATEVKTKDFATVSYVGSNEVIDRLSIKLKGKVEIPVYTPEIGMLAVQESGNSVANDGKTLIMARLNKDFKASDMKGFAMKISYYLPGVKEPYIILLPVRNDRVDLDNATYDKSLFEIVKI